jgi:hypothetical protein
MSVELPDGSTTRALLGCAVTALGGRRLMKSPRPRPAGFGPSAGDGEPRVPRQPELADGAVIEPDN